MFEEHIISKGQRKKGTGNYHSEYSQRVNVVIWYPWELAPPEELQQLSGNALRLNMFSTEFSRME